MHKGVRGDEKVKACNIILGSPMPPLFSAQVKERNNQRVAAARSGARASAKTSNSGGGGGGGGSAGGSGGVHQPQPNASRASYSGWWVVGGGGVGWSRDSRLLRPHVQSLLRPQAPVDLAIFVDLAIVAFASQQPIASHGCYTPLFR